MAILKITARDSSSAMEEVSKKLGADAYILATTAKEGGVEIEASNDPIEIKKYSEKTKKSFTGLIRRELGNITEFPKSKSQDKQSNRWDSQDSPNMTMKDYNEIAKLNKSVQSLLSEITGMYITNSDGLGPEMGQTTTVKLQNANFDSRVIKRLSPSFQGLNYDRGRKSFMKALAKALTQVGQTDQLEHITFVTGLSGVGKTTLTSKLAAAHMHKTDEKVVLASLGQKNANHDETLRSHARMLNTPVVRVNPDNLIETLSSTKERTVIDVSLEPMEAVNSILGVKEFFSDRSQSAILAITGGTNKVFIKNQAAAFSELSPRIALTKLDECDISSIELSEFFLNDMKIHYLTGSRSIVGGLSICNNEILSQYLMENC